jgi:hypothetical protein
MNSYGPIVVQIAAFCAVPFANAQGSTQEVLSSCRPIAVAEVVNDSIRFNQDFSTGYCWGVFTAIQDVIVRGDSDGNRYFSVCSPPESTLSQLIAIFVNYAEKNPQRFHENYFQVAMDSLVEAFPCPE